MWQSTHIEHQVSSKAHLLTFLPIIYPSSYYTSNTLPSLDVCPHIIHHNTLLHPRELYEPPMLDQSSPKWQNNDQPDPFAPPPQPLAHPHPPKTIIEDNLFGKKKTVLGPAAAGNSGTTAGVKGGGAGQKQGPGPGQGQGLPPPSQDGPRDPVRDLVDAFRVKTEREKKLSR